MKSISRSVICLILLLSVSTLSALTIKLGSLVPTGSPWDISLKQIAADWQKISEGKVILKIYPGGIAGDEVDMIRKIRIGQLDASAMTGIGMNNIFPGVVAVQLPLLIRTDQELTYVLDKMEPYLEKKIGEKGFKVLLWSQAGWTYFYSKKPVITPEDMKDRKLFVWQGDSDLIQTWKELGFHPVPLAGTDIMTSLQSGMIDTLTASPLTTASFQWFGIAKHMSGLKWAPFIGAVVISEKIWKKIPADLQDKLFESAQRIGKNMQKQALEADRKAIVIMKKHGLKIHPVSKAVELEWKKTVDMGLKGLIGKSIDKEAYEKVKEYLEEYRKKNKK
ncbi:MAG: TRAP transporter substrate-binding protein DctP [Spirochaetes bacterium]|nr:TRAP transporter substrate-binding protein DctP [Spirochaetota bacterium]